MDQAVAAKWVEELRSGNYAQTNGYLQVVESKNEKQPAGFCCLGVLCEVLIKDGVELETHEQPHPSGPKVMTYGDSSALFPHELSEVSGLENGSGGFIEIRDLIPLVRESVLDAAAGPAWKGKQNFKLTLVDLNDNGATFEEIANVIEEHWESL